MKRKYVLSALFMGTLGFCTYAYSTQILDWAFRAPSLSDPDAIDPVTAGDIVFDTSTDKFRGFDGGNWVDFGAGAGSNLNVESKTGAYSLVLSDDIILADANSAGFTLSLPAASGYEGKVFRVKKTDVTFNVVTIDPDSTELIDGSSTATLNTEDESISFVSDGSGWQILNRQIPSKWVSYSPSLSTFGTVSNLECQYRRQGSDLEIRCKFTSGTLQGSEARAELPTGLTSAGSGVIPSIQVGQGYWMRGNSVLSHGGNVLIEPSVGYVTFSSSDTFTQTTLNPLTKVNASAMATNGDIINFYASVPVAGWQ